MVPFEIYGSNVEVVVGHLGDSGGLSTAKSKAPKDLYTLFYSDLEKLRKYLAHWVYISDNKEPY